MGEFLKVLAKISAKYSVDRTTLKEEADTCSTFVSDLKYPISPIPDPAKKLHVESKNNLLFGSEQKIATMFKLLN